MFKLFRKNPLAKLEAEYARVLEAARDAQRGGKMPRFAELTAESEKIARRIDELRAGPNRRA